MNPKTIFTRLLFATLFCISVLSATYAQSPRQFSEAHVLRSLRQIHSAQATYQATTGNGNYGSLQDLRQAGFIDDALVSGSKYGYLYAVSTIPSVPWQSASSFTVTATPRLYRKSGIRSFFIDGGGEIHGGDKNGQVGTSSDPIIDDCTNGSIPDNERCTIDDMRALYSAQVTYATTIGNQNFAFLPRLYQFGLIRSDLADGAARGYYYTVLKIDYVPRVQVASFKIWARPQAYGTTAIRSFFIDQTGVLRGADKNGGQANENDPPIN